MVLPQKFEVSTIFIVLLFRLWQLFTEIRHEPTKNLLPAPTSKWRFEQPKKIDLDSLGRTLSYLYYAFCYRGK
jgi:hypothetical protein